MITHKFHQLCFLHFAGHQVVMVNILAQLRNLQFLEPAEFGFSRPVYLFISSIWGCLNVSLQFDELINLSHLRRSRVSILVLVLIVISLPLLSVRRFGGIRPVIGREDGVAESLDNVAIIQHS